MSRLVYISPDSNTPTGGIKVIYKHAELLASLGVPATVMHFAQGYRCDWFNHQAPIAYIDQLLTSDIVMVPEIMTILGTQLHSIGVRYCMFVQNGYLVLPTRPIQEVWECYKNAVAIVSISEDTSDYLASVFPEFAHKIVRVKYSVDTARFKPEAKLNKATFMPRKLPHHASNVVPWLAKEFPGWTFQPIHGMNEDQVAEHLRTSRVFLAFSDFEGCPVPPIEAALCGNVVVGYPGWGGLEYWHAPNFLKVEMGHMRQFVDQFRQAAAMSLRADAQLALAPGMAALAHDYGLQAEKALLLAGVQRVHALAAATPARLAEPVKLAA
ncbi:hypothetical protein [Ideonella sp. BN130291]|uniref:hypothetical protein n=1 Tax=Ideonella sp. BN130291 TaxID=3112940 RepID=UPI002E276357|nr:hypothetical protein [Ideonella sp. BN130291]